MISLLLLLLAQLPTPPLTAGEAFTVVADHAGANTLSYRLVMDGATIDTLPVASVLGGEVKFARTGLPSGIYAIRIEAVNSLTMTPSDTLMVPVEAVPPQTTCTTQPLTLNITEWQRAVAMRDPRGMVIGWTIKGPARVTKIQIDLVDDGTPGWEILYAATGMDGRDVFGIRVAPKKIGKWELVIVVEDERGCKATHTGTRTVQVVQ